MKYGSFFGKLSLESIVCKWYLRHHLLEGRQPLQFLQRTIVRGIGFTIELIINVMSRYRTTALPPNPQPPLPFVWTPRTILSYACIILLANGWRCTAHPPPPPATPLFEIEPWNFSFGRNPGFFSLLLLHAESPDRSFCKFGVLARGCTPKSTTMRSRK